MLLALILSLAAFAAAAPRNLIERSSASSLVDRQTNSLPNSFSWTSSDVLVTPKNDGRAVAGIKDPSIIYHNNVYHVFASTANAEGYSLVYFNFTDFSKANQAPFYYLDQSGIGTGYRAAPEVFYFAPQKLWYLIYQNGNAAYSTNKDIRNPAGWTAPKTFYSGTPALIAEGLLKPQQGYWVDMWVVCDDKNCHLFSHDDNGRLYRSQTTLAQFPNGMSDPVIALQDANKNDLFEAANVYSVGNGTYLLLVECIGSGASAGGVRYFRSWTSKDLAGPWTPLAATQDRPFMGEANVQFSGTKWTKSISHGEMIRTNVDQKLSIGACGWRYMYQGIDPAANADYNALPWKLGLLTQKGGC
ncbi:alpha-L-arab-like proteininofuranosidase precursor [Paraphoma chrysanthemicola]|uniref:Alpha-L-arabinofuranosidase n=1 Tax=Paraphoma chrysanthemicola TaxID=798071 RepID=A0A8K0VRX0_9PLEO|nr:alpha-L-arab-like proteininofuranosidase precursor [Paraphoma chrysanthemicola]